MTAITMDIPRYSSSSGEDGEITMAAGVTITPRVNNTRSPLSDTDIEYEEIEDTDNGMAFQEEDDIAEYWDPYLYQLQQQAPKPHKVVCTRDIPDRPTWYSDEYHGSITREETSKLLGKEDGHYLVRQGLSQSGTYSLSFVFGLSVKHYHLHFENGEYYVGETTFDDIEDLVADGLIALYMEENNVDEYLKSARETTEVRRTSLLPNKLEPILEKQGLEQSEPLPPPLPPRNRGSIGKAPVSNRIDEDCGGDVYINVQPSRDRNKDGSLKNYHYEKPHNFKVHTFYSMPWCDYCKNFLWGLKKQGYKCKDCGYVTHKQCKDCAPSDCQPSKQLIKRAYGVDLTTLLKTHGTKVPLVVKECVQELDKRGLGLEGIYRVPGKSLEVLQIKKSFDQELSCDFDLYPDTHAIAGALKLYIRELPIPLITFDCYELILVAARCSKLEETLETVKVILDRLPLAHYNTLRFLMKHLNDVQTAKDQNKMDCKNLAVVFAPSIMRPPANYDELLGMMKLPEQKKVTDVLISHYTTLFR